VQDQQIFRGLDWMAINAADVFSAFSSRTITTHRQHPNSPEKKFSSFTFWTEKYPDGFGACFFFVLVGFPGHFLIASLHLSIVYALVFHSPFIRYFATVDYLPIFHWA
jgi:hypothetical protein